MFPVNRCGLHHSGEGKYFPRFYLMSIGLLGVFYFWGSSKKSSIGVTPGLRSLWLSEPSCARAIDLMSAEKVVSSGRADVHSGKAWIFVFSWGWWIDPSRGFWYFTRLWFGVWLSKNNAQGDTGLVTITPVTRDFNTVVCTNHCRKPSSLVVVVLFAWWDSVFLCSLPVLEPRSSRLGNI